MLNNRRPATPLQKMAADDLMDAARQVAKERNCSILVAIGLIQSDLTQKLRNIDAARSDERG